jgi:hypothetical protein
MISYFGPQNYVGDCLSVAPQNQWEDVMTRATRHDLMVCFVWKQVGIEFLSLTSRLADA